MNQALLIIDAQQELIEGNREQKSVFKKEELIANINLVIGKALDSNALIVFVRDTDVAEGKGKGFQIHQDISLPPTYEVFDKAATNSFYGTGLKSFLEEQIINHHNKILHGHYNVDKFSIIRKAKEDLFQPTHDTYR